MSVLKVTGERCSIFVYANVIRSELSAPNVQHVKIENTLLIVVRLSRMSFFALECRYDLK